MEKQIRTLYYDKGFQTPLEIYNILKNKYKTVTEKKVENIVNTFYTKQVVKPRQIRKDTFSSIYAKKKGEQYQWDLVDYSKFSKSNKGYKFLMNMIDVYTRYAVSIPIKAKTIKEILPAFKKAIKIMGVVPENLTTDLEKAIMGNAFQSYLKENNIKHYPTPPYKKRNASIIERFNRTLREKLLKYMTSRDTNKYSNELDNIVMNYNNSKHRGINAKPSSMWFKNLKSTEVNPQVSTDTFDIKLGDKVRVLHDRDPFKKSSDMYKYSKQVYTVIGMKGKRFIVKDDDETKEKMGYELQKVNKVEKFTVGNNRDKENKKNAEESRLLRRTKKEGIESNFTREGRIITRSMK